MASPDISASFDNSCPLPHANPIERPGYVRDGTDITPPTFEVLRDEVDQKAIDRFLGNLRTRCGTYITKNFGEVSIFHVPTEYHEKI